MVLPSRRAGETWGLVVNEALQAGCAVIVSEGRRIVEGVL